LRDVRVLQDYLLGHENWDEAGHAYAEAHDRHYGVIHTIDNWLSQIFFETGSVAEARRAKAPLDRTRSDQDAGSCRQWTGAACRRDSPTTLLWRRVGVGLGRRFHSDFSRSKRGLSSRAPCARSGDTSVCRAFTCLTFTNTRVMPAGSCTSVTCPNRFSPSSWPMSAIGGILLAPGETALFLVHSVGSVAIGRPHPIISFVSPCSQDWSLERKTPCEVQSFFGLKKSLLRNAKQHRTHYGSQRIEGHRAAVRSPTIVTGIAG